MLARESLSGRGRFFSPLCDNEAWRPMGVVRPKVSPVLTLIPSEQVVWTIPIAPPVPGLLDRPLDPDPKSLRLMCIPAPSSWPTRVKRKRAVRWTALVNVRPTCGDVAGRRIHSVSAEGCTPVQSGRPLPGSQGGAFVQEASVINRVVVVPARAGAGRTVMEAVIENRKGYAAHPGQVPGSMTGSLAWRSGGTAEAGWQGWPRLGCHGWRASARTRSRQSAGDVAERPGPVVP